MSWLVREIGWNGWLRRSFGTTARTCRRTPPALFGSAILLLLPLCAATKSQKLDAHPDPVVRVDGGSLRGAMRGGIAVFQGIPFAAPPVGDLRWRAPQSVGAWAGIRDAAKPGSSCTQDAAGLNPFIAPLAAEYGAAYTGQPVASSEDCLYLNVWVPNWPEKAGLPVMVWLHGGSNRTGSGAQSTYSGGSLVAHGVILVTVNYRLGVMGFLSNPELTAESAQASSGNYGILDQLAALRWVQRNIAQFGGDPWNVTLFGESAGSIDAGMLLASPLSTGLFRRVILESGPPFGLGAPRTRSEAEAVGAAIAKAAPGNATSPLANLRRMPSSEVVKLAARVEKEQFKGFDPSAPIVDGLLLPQAPAQIFAAGTMQKADVMVGLNGRELSAFRIAGAAAQRQAAKQGVKPEPGGSLSAALDSMANTARPLYGNWTSLAMSWYIGEALFRRDAAIDQAGNDMLMACPIGALGALMNSAGQHAYVYEFDRSIPGKGQADLGAFHGLEVPFVFNAFDDPAWQWLRISETDRELSGIMETYWTNFAKTGNPNGPGLPAWAPWKDGDEPYLDFASSGKAEPRRGFSPLLCHLGAERIKSQLGKK
jgi:para-nitrobenzyl esterase